MITKCKMCLGKNVALNSSYSLKPLEKNVFDTFSPIPSITVAFPSIIEQIIITSRNTNIDLLRQK